MRKRQLVFIALGLIITTGIFNLAKLNIARATKVDGKIFHDWRVSCIPTNQQNKLPEICSVSQQFEVSEDGQKKVIAVYRLGYFGVNKELKSIQLIPLGVTIGSGTSVVSSGKLISPGRFTTCTLTGCLAVALVSNTDLKSMLSGKENSLAFINADGKQVNFSISVKGLAQALDYIK